MKIILVLTKT